MARYRAAVDAKNEIDPDFVIMAQCYARNAVNGGMAEILKRLGFMKRKRASIGCNSKRPIPSTRSSALAKW